MTKRNKVATGIAGSLGVIWSFAIGLVTPELLLSVLSQVFHNQIAQAGFFFTLAAWIHGKQVRNEIKAQLSPIAKALEELGVNIKNDMDKHNERLEKLENFVFKQQSPQEG